MMLQLQIEIKLDRPGVGSNLQDHIFGLIGPFLIDKPLSILFDRDLLSLKNAFNYLGSGSGPLGSPATPAMGFFVSSSARASLQDFDYPDIQLTMQNYGVASILDVAFGMFTNVPAEKFRKFFGSENFGKDGFFIINALVRPKSRGKIVLGSPDPEAYPLIHAGYYTHPDDITVIVEGVRTKF
jgi:choline dehydrogenase-like flavoprotein